MPEDTQVMPRPRVLLADDHVETAMQLGQLLSSRFDVVASVEDGLALLSAATIFTPDVIVTDIAHARPRWDRGHPPHPPR